jgi:hypothetical protein
MDSLKDTILNYRNKFKRLGRTYHILIGSQLFFGLAAFRYHRHQNNLINSNNNSNNNTPIKTNLIITESGSELVSAQSVQQRQHQQQHQQQK